MDFKGILNRYGAYVAAVIIFLALAYIYCSPQLGGKVLFAGDQQTFTGAVHESQVYHDETGEFTFWNGAMFSGMPNYQIGGGYYTAYTLLQPVNSFIQKKGNPAWIIFLYFLCFFICLRCFDVDKWLSIAGAIAIGLSSYFLTIIAAGHLTKCETIAATAVVLGAFNLIFSKKKYIPGAVLTMLFVAAGATKHPQMFYYYFMLIGLLWVVQFIFHVKEKKVKDMLIGTAVFCVAVGVGLGANCADVFANAEYTRETMRGGQSDLVREGAAAEASPSDGLDLRYATEYSYGIGESLSFLVPNARGGSNKLKLGKNSHLYKTLTSKGLPASFVADYCKEAPMYWGDQPVTAGNVYMGAVVCFLFLLGCMIVKGPHKWGLLIATVFSIMLAWGHNFMWLTKLFFNYFPLYNKFRSVSSILIVAEVAMPLLGFLAVREIILGRVEKKKLLKSILWSAGVTGGICLVLALIGGSIFSFSSPNDASWNAGFPDELYDIFKDQRAVLLRSDALRSAAFIATAALTLWLFVKGKIRKSGLLAAILGVLVLLDLWPVDRRYFNDGNFVSRKQQMSSFAMLPYEEALTKDPDLRFRVMNLTVDTFNDSRTSYYLNSVGGYSAAKLRRYNDLIDEHLTKMHQPVIDMLNTKYLITSGQDGSAVPMLNPGALGNAWFVSEIKVVDNANQESDALNSVDLSRVAVVGREFEGSLAGTSPGIAEDAEITLTAYTPKSLDYKVKSSRDGTVVFSEIYYPYGWKATIDGKKADHFRADYVLRAMNVPAGEHTINFTFDPDSVRKGNSLSVACIMLMYLATVLAAAFGIWKYFRKKKA